MLNNSQKSDLKSNQSNNNINLNNKEEFTMNNYRERIRKIVNESNMDNEDKMKILQNLIQADEQKINILITGATGCGKSSTINALFGTEVAKVGVTSDPETMEIEKYTLENLVLWDSPGLGDGKEADNRHAKNIIKKLNEVDENNDPLIDLVLVILDGSSRDLGTSYQLINEVIIPNLGDEKDARILVAINQADEAMKGRYWNREENKPEEPLIKFLDEKAESVKQRIKASTVVTVEPIYYSAGYKEEGKKQEPSYNLLKLLDYIVRKTPKKKRLIYMDKLNNDAEMWKDNDDLRDYGEEIRGNLFESILEGVSNGAEIGGAIGSIFGKPGEIAGKIVGGVIGAGVEIIKGIGECISDFLPWNW